MWSVIFHSFPCPVSVHLCGNICCCTFLLSRLFPYSKMQLHILSLLSTSAIFYPQWKCSCTACTFLSLLSTSAIFHTLMKVQLYSLYRSVSAVYLCHLPFPNRSAAVQHVLFCLCCLPLQSSIPKEVQLHSLYFSVSAPYLWRLPYPNGSAAVCTACILPSLLPTYVISLSRMELQQYSLYSYISAPYLYHFTIPEWNFCSLPLSSSIPQWKWSWASLYSLLSPPPDSLGSIPALHSSLITLQATEWD